MFEANFFWGWAQDARATNALIYILDTLTAYTGGTLNSNASAEIPLECDFGCLLPGVGGSMIPHKRGIGFLI